MLIPYRTPELVIAGNARKYQVFDTLHNPSDGSILVTDPIFDGSLPQCKAFVDGYMLRADRDE